MILTGKEDLRVVKTIEGIKAAFEELICEKNYEQITVKELCDKARINKKTFYHYYETLYFLLAEMQAEFSSGYVERVKDFKLPEELDKVNREFFLFSVEQGMAYEKITCSVAYSAVRQDMIDEVIAGTWGKSKTFMKMDSLYQNLLINYINTVSVGTYRQWVADGKKIPLEDVISLSNALICKGTEGFMKQVK